MLIVFCSVFFCSNLAHADTGQNELLLTELQTATTTSSNQEFIEVYNSAENSVDLSNYVLEYFSASSTSATATWSVELTGNLGADSYYLLARTSYLTDKRDQEFTSALADSGGYVRIVQKNSGLVVDGLGWGGSTRFEGQASSAPAKSKSLARSIGQTDYIDTDNNHSDFSTLDTPNPRLVNYIYVPEEELPPEVPIEESPESTDNPEEQAPVEEVPVVLPPVVQLLEPYITELLPNPASPLTDADDEYVELYNPNDVAFDLSGYKIQTGNTYSYSYAISGISIPAKSYVAFYSKDSGLTLSNTSSKARLQDKEGQTVSETDPYSDAKEGEVWQFYAGAWQWSISGSPGANNIQTLPTALSTLKAVSAKKPKTTTAKTTKAKQASAKTAKATAQKKSTKKDEKGPTNNFQETEAPQTVHPLMLAMTGLLALSYGIYEYRFEISNLFRQFRINGIFGGGPS